MERVYLVIYSFVFLFIGCTWTEMIWFHFNRASLSSVLKYSGVGGGREGTKNTTKTESNRSLFLFFLN